MTQMTTIVAKYVNEPKEGKKYGSIKAETGERYLATPYQLSKVQPGETVALEWEPKTWGGDTVMVVTNVYPSGAQPQRAAPAPTPASSSPSASNGANGHDKSTQSRDMFVMGVVGRAMGSGNFSVSDITALATAADAAWEALQARRRGAQDPRDFEPAPPWN